MNIVATAAAILVVFAGIYFYQKDKGDIDRDKGNEQVLSESDNQSISDETINSITDTPEPTEKPEPTLVPTSVPTQKPDDDNLSSFKYPNSQIVTNSENSLELGSSDDAKNITDWYKAKINSLGMNIKTFVTTSANDKILNKLVGADGQKEISIEITQENQSSPVKISVIID